MKRMWDWLHIVFYYSQNKHKVIYFYRFLDNEWFLVYKCTMNWLFFTLFSSLLKNEGRKKGEWRSKNRFSKGILNHIFKTPTFKTWEYILSSAGTMEVEKHRGPLRPTNTYNLVWKVSQLSLVNMGLFSYH